MKKMWISVACILLFTLGCTGRDIGEEKSDMENAQKKENLKILSVEAYRGDESVPQNAVDGDLATRWAAPGDSWLVLELPEAAEVDSVDIAFYKGDERKTRFALEVSGDGDRWKRVYYGESSGYTRGFERYIMEESGVRFIRIVGEGNTENTQSSISEIEVVGRGVSKNLPPGYQGDYELDTSTLVYDEYISEEVILYEAPETYIEELVLTPGWKGEWRYEEAFGINRNTEYVEGEILRVHYPKGSIDPASALEGKALLGGAEFYLRSAREDEMELSYKIRFSEDFDFALGGKLPGLFGGSEGGELEDTWNTRFMWRKNGAGEIYLHLPKESESESSLGRGAWYFVPGQWHEMVQRVRLNTPGRADGRIEVYQDGSRVLLAEGLVFRESSDIKIEGLMFSTYFGGTTPEWASPEDVHIDFRDFKIAK